MKNSNSLKKKALTFASIFLLSNVAFAGWVDDSTITTKVKAKYLAHPAISAWDIGVATTDSQVKLTGHANSFTQLDAAVRIASDIDGVEDIDVDELTVEKSEHPATDAKVTARVYGELIKSKLLEKDHPNHAKIVVETVNAHVFLSGHVKDEVEEKYILATIENVKDVRTVTSFLDKKPHSK